MTTTPKYAGAQVPFGTGFRRYDPAAFDLIPLNLWNARKRLRNGRVKDIGKAPVDDAWTTMPVDSRKTRARCLAHERNMGVRMRADQLVLDCDPRNYQNGVDSLLLFCADVGLDPGEWPRVRTGSGGSHFYMSLPADFAVQEALDEYPGIEFKSIGRQVVAAGSRHPNGKLYRWDSRYPDIREGLPRAPTPLLKLIKRPLFSHNSAGIGGQYTVAELARALARLNPKAFRDELKWRTLMFACHHATEGEGESVFVDWSASDPQFAADSADVVKRWRSCNEGRKHAVTYRTLNFILRQHGASDVQIGGGVLEDFPDEILGDDDRAIEVLGD